MGVIDVISRRRSYRGKYKPIPAPRADLAVIMKAGLDAPSGCNMQTTSLIAVDAPELLKKLRSVINPPVGETAPAVICVLTQRINAYRDKCFAVQDYSAAIENMLLALEEMGYQSCWYEGHITDEDKIGYQMAQILNVPMIMSWSVFSRSVFLKQKLLRQGSEPLKKKRGSIHFLLKKPIPAALNSDLIKRYGELPLSALLHIFFE